MKAYNSCDIEIGNTDIPIKIYSAIEQETHLKQISACCNAEVHYNRVCSNCNKVLGWGEIKKAVPIGEELKEIDANKLKLESGNLKILGLINDCEEEGIFKDGSVWFIGFEFDKKNKSKTQRNLTKFSYLKEILKTTSKTLIGLINLRGKEHIVMLKSYFNALVGLGLYHFDRIRDITEITGYNENFVCDEETLKQMALTFVKKTTINIKDIENTRNKILEAELSKETGKEVKTENPLEICNF